MAKGDFSNSDIPENIAALSSLYSGLTAKFMPIGDMDGSGSNITWTQRTYELDFSDVGLGVDVTGTFVAVTVTEDMIEIGRAHV